MNQAPILYRLQNIDIQLDQIAQRRGQILTNINADHTVQRAEENIRNIEENKSGAIKALARIEDELGTIRIKLETNESSLYHGSIKNPKELQDLQTENDSIKKRIITMEDHQLDALMQLEKIETELNNASHELNQVKASLIMKQAGWSGEESQLSSQKETLQTERKALLSSILPDNLQLYERLRQEKRGVAISRIDENTCGACGTEIRPAELQTARSPQTMATCGSCGRILYSG